jgi:2-methylcitrate dehydratase PrpD
MKTREGYTERVARFVVDTRLENIPTDAVRTAKNAILDCLGVALAGSREKCARICTDQARLENAFGAACLWGQGFKSSATLAAFANGTAAHAMDYDHSVYWGQPTSGLVPSLMSLGESLGAGGRELLEAFVAGFEFTSKAAKEVTDETRNGWTSTGTLGSLGAALGCAKLLGIDSDRVQQALGIAGSMAGGLVCNYGTMSKPLHAGLAARNGVLAAQLAQRGYSANPKSLESENGFYQGFLPFVRDSGSLDELGSFYELSRGIKIKNYPCGGLTHSAIDAVLEMRTHHPLAAEMIESIEVEVPQQTYKRIAFLTPQTGLEGKFCMGYIVARAIIDGKITLDAFTDRAVREESILELARRVHMRPNRSVAESPGLGRPCKVSVLLKNGQSYARHVEHEKGSREAPLSPQEIRAKFIDCAGRCIEAPSIQKTLEYVEHLEELHDLRPLCENLMGAS